MSVSLLLDEETTGSYADDLTLPPIMPRVIAIPGARDVLDVAGLTANEIAIVQRDGSLALFLDISWTAASARNTEIEIREQGTTDSFNDSTIATAYRYSGVAVGTIYEYRARHVSGEGHAGTWTSYQAITIGGDLTPPETAAGLVPLGIPNGYRLDWTASTADDYAYTEVFQGTTGSVFADATLVARISGTSYSRLGIADQTTFEIWIRHADQSGNVGGTTQAQVTTQVIQLTGRHSAACRGCDCDESGVRRPDQSGGVGDGVGGQRGCGCAVRRGERDGVEWFCDRGGRFRVVVVSVGNGFGGVRYGFGIVIGCGDRERDECGK